MNEPEQNVVSEYYDNYKETQAYIFKTAARKTRNMIFVVSIVLLLGDILGLAMANALTAQTFLASVVFPIIFFGLGFVAVKQPMIAIVISIVVFAIILVLTFVAAGSASLISGLLVKAVIVFCLIAGFNNAREAQKTKREIQ